MRSLVSRAAVAAAAALSLAACSDKNADVLMPPPPGSNAAFMARYVALGNSITAGYQSGGINDSTQKQSYARLFALQAGAPYTYVSIPAPCAPPLASLTGATVNPKGACPGVAPVPTILNSVAVPGATTADGFTGITSSWSALTSFILGGKSQATRALDANPTFVSMWLGNNDVLNAALSGMPQPLTIGTTVISAGATPVATFKANYDATLDTLGRVGGLKGALIGVVNAMNAPALFPAESLLTNPAFRAAFQQYTGYNPANVSTPFYAVPVTVDTNCAGSGKGALLYFGIVTEINKWRADTTTNLQKKLGHPPTITCVKSTTSPPLGNAFILDKSEQAFVTDLVNQYNAHIQARADERGWVYLDPNGLLAQLRTQGQVPAIPNLANPAQPYGPFISIDGIHPAAPAHRLVANGLIDAVNAKYGSAIPKLP